jgi:glycolate oxidase FAD binding subunit
MQELRPTSERELCDALQTLSAGGTVIALNGASTKRKMGGPLAADPGAAISTSCLRRVLQYEPRDLTVSVEAGLPFAEFSAMLARDRQMVPLDPPYFEHATVGGVVAANTAGPRRRLYGSARDMVIGMSFAKLDGKMTKSGGMVVKNVAGFDMAKLMIGSFGTLAAITVVNFKLAPMPPETRTFCLQFETAEQCMAARDRIVRGVLQPAAVDALNPAAARRVGLEGFVLLIEAGGSAVVMARYASELAGAVQMDGDRERDLWTGIREFTPGFVAGQPGARVVRVSSTLSETPRVFASTSAPVLSRAASGVSYLHFDGADGAAEWAARPEASAWRYVFEYGQTASNRFFGSDFAMMKAVKDLFDPASILNPGRLYGRL